METINLLFAAAVIASAAGLGVRNPSIATLLLAVAVLLVLATIYAYPLPA